MIKFRIEGSLLVTLTPFKTVILSSGPISIKFEKEHFHMFTNNNWEYNFEMEVPFFLSKLFISIKLFIFGVFFFSNLNRNIFTCLPLVNNITYNTIWKERKDKFESDNVFNLVWDNHCDARSHIKSFSKLKNFDPISKCPV